LRSVAVCCSVLQCVAVCCSVLQCAAVCCSVLQCVAVCCGVLQFVAAVIMKNSYNHNSSTGVLQRVAMCCSVLQCVAMCCNVVVATTVALVCRSVLQCVAVCCSALQCVAMCCSVLQWWWDILTTVTSSTDSPPPPFCHYVCHPNVTNSNQWVIWMSRTLSKHKQLNESCKRHELNASSDVTNSPKTSPTERVIKTSQSQINVSFRCHKLT